jgi:hypothetical protein
MKIVALLESMWGWQGFNEPGEEAPRYFRINPDNHSGRRLYRICGPGHSLLVTNCCRIVQSSANHHGSPDIEWTRNNLLFLQQQKMDLLLVCGHVARETFAQICQMSTHNLIPGVSGLVGVDHENPARVRYLIMDHPAARRWSNQKIDETAALVAAILAR